MAITAKTTFLVKVFFNNPEKGSELKEFKKINHAMRHLWKSRNVAEGFLYIMKRDSVTDIKLSEEMLLAKIGRRRGIYGPYTSATPTTQARPQLKKAGPGWQRLPNRFNDIQ